MKIKNGKYALLVYFYFYFILFAIKKAFNAGSGVTKQACHIIQISDVAKTSQTHFSDSDSLTLTVRERLTGFLKAALGSSEQISPRNGFVSASLWRRNSQGFSSSSFADPYGIPDSIADLFRNWSKSRSL